jgi:hypothetical protein
MQTVSHARVLLCMNAEGHKCLKCLHAWPHTGGGHMRGDRSHGWRSFLQTWNFWRNETTCLKWLMVWLGPSNKTARIDIKRSAGLFTETAVTVIGSTGPSDKTTGTDTLNSNYAIYLNSLTVAGTSVLFFNSSERFMTSCAVLINSSDGYRNTEQLTKTALTDSGTIGAFTKTNGKVYVCAI